MDEEQIKRDALSLLAMLKTRGWQVAEELFDTALLTIQDRVFTSQDGSMDSVTVLAARAQGARELAESFKAALRAASEVEMPEPAAGLAQESNDSANTAS